MKTRTREASVCCPKCAHKFVVREKTPGPQEDYRFRFVDYRAWNPWRGHPTPEGDHRVWRAVDEAFAAADRAFAAMDRAFEGLFR